MHQLDSYQMEEMEMSWTNQLDVVGMQPHSREYLEHCMNYGRSARKFEMVEGQEIDCPYGIQFSGKP